MIDIDIMQDASEIVHYDNQDIPLYIRHGLLSYYPEMRALCHWHEDIELIYIIDGEMNYDVNGHKILLKKGDTIVINSRQMHYGYSHQKNECSFICILFHPSLLSSNAYAAKEYLKPIIDNPNIEYIAFTDDSPERTEMEKLQKRIMNLKESKSACFEFEIISLLYHLWSIIYRICKEKDILNLEKELPSDLLIQKKMVSYIYQNYKETISLDQIASSGSVSRSKCCILFKRYLQQSPIDFLNDYRLEVSCNLLKNSDANISSIALACGFNNLSYYSKIFLRKYKSTPSAYRHNF